MNIWSLPVCGSDSSFGMDSVDSESSLSFELGPVQLFIEPAVALEVILKYSILILYVGDYPRINFSPRFSLVVGYLNL